MKTQTGVWLDKEKAIIINLIGGKHTVKTIESEIDARERYPGETKRFGRFGGQFLSMENKKKEQGKKTVLSQIVFPLLNFGLISKEELSSMK